jgi:hypothetical protein
MIQYQKQDCKIINAYLAYFPTAVLVGWVDEWITERAQTGMEPWNGTFSPFVLGCKARSARSF